MIDQYLNFLCSSNKNTFKNNKFFNDNYLLTFLLLLKGNKYFLVNPMNKYTFYWCILFQSYQHMHAENLRVILAKLPSAKRLEKLYDCKRFLNGQYCGRVFVFTDVGHPLKHPTLDQPLRFNLLSQELWVDLKIALICEQAFLVKANQVVGASWSYQDWSKYFKSIIEPMKMHHYSSKGIRPDYKLMIF